MSPFSFGFNQQPGFGAAGTSNTNQSTTSQPTFNFGGFGTQNNATSSVSGGLNNTPTPAPATSSFPTVGTGVTSGFGTGQLSVSKPPVIGNTTTQPATTTGFGFGTSSNTGQTATSGFGFSGGYGSAAPKPADPAAQPSTQLNMQNLQKQMTNITPDDILQKCPSDFKNLISKIDTEQAKAKKTLQTLETTIEKNKGEYATIYDKMTALNHRLCELESCQTAMETEAEVLTNSLAIQRDLARKLSANDPNARELGTSYWEYKLSTLQEKHQRLQTQLQCLATALGIPVNTRIPVQNMDELYALLESLYQQARTYQIKLGLD